MPYPTGSRTCSALDGRGLRLALVLFCAATGSACASDDATAFESFTRARLQAVESFCGCFWDQRFDDHAACVRVMRDDPGVAACRAEAYLAHNDELEPEMACRTLVMRRYEACLQRASCDPTATGACDTQAEAEFEQCPRASEAANESSAEQTEACVMGMPSGCPDMGPATSITGTAVVRGSTVGAGADLGSQCGGGAAPDVAMLWTAPVSGNFTIDTNGSGYDTLLSVRTACDGVELACNDDWDAAFLSRLSLDMEAGQTVLIVVDGYGNLAGDFVLNIESSP